MGICVCMCVKAARIKKYLPKIVENLKNWTLSKRDNVLHDEHITIKVQ